MKIKLIAVSVLAVALFTTSAICAAQDARTCRERNLQSIADRLQMSENLTLEQAALLVRLRHQLQVYRTFRERQTVAKTLPAAPWDDQAGAGCTECSEH